MVQGQIGGESRPGSMSNFAKANALPPQQRCRRGTGNRARLDAIDCRGEPSGRLLESRREARPRGMIAAARRRLRQRAAQNPAYRPVRHFSMTYAHLVGIQPARSLEGEGWDFQIVRNLHPPFAISRYMSISTQHMQHGFPGRTEIPAPPRSYSLATAHKLQQTAQSETDFSFVMVATVFRLSTEMG